MKDIKILRPALESHTLASYGILQAGRKTDLKAAILVIFSGTNIAVMVYIFQAVFKKTGQASLFATE